MTTTNGKPGNVFVFKSQKTQEQYITLELLEEMLQHIDPNNGNNTKDSPRVGWVKILAGIYDYFKDEGKDVARSWSEHGLTFDSSNFEYTWRTFRRNEYKTRKVSIGTVIYFAKIGGWSPKDSNFYQMVKEESQQEIESQKVEEPLKLAIDILMSYPSPTKDIVRPKNFDLTKNGQVFKKFSEPDEEYEYIRNLFYVQRYNYVDERGTQNKVCVPQYWNGTKWIRQKPEGLLPLYNWEKIEQAIDKELNCRIIICEGEKAANAASILFPNDIATTTIGGSSRADESDFSPLEGMNVIIWPDNDKAGEVYANDVGILLFKIGAKEVSFLNLNLFARNFDIKSDNSEPSEGVVLGLPKGFDAADALQAGVTAEYIEAFLEQKDSLQKPIISSQEINQIRQEHLITKPTQHEGKIVSIKNFSPSDIKKTSWLWNGWLLQGELNLLSGMPGTGKTNIAINLGSIISQGGKFPDGSDCEKGQVIMWSGEDDICTTLLPRLFVNNGNFERFQFITGNIEKDGKETVFDFRNDLERLISAVREKSITSSVPVKMIIIDPILATIAGDSNSAKDVRESLAPLVDMARSLNISILGICHYNKGLATGDPMLRILGSIAFAGTARMCLGVISKKLTGDGSQDENDKEGKRVNYFARLKTNKSSMDNGFEYEIEEKPVLKEKDGERFFTAEQAEKEKVEKLLTISEGTKVSWTRTIDGSPADIFNDSPKKSERASLLAEARAFLQDKLRNGPVPSSTLIEEGHELGYSEPTLRRAKKELNIGHKKEPSTGSFLWYLQTGKKPYHELDIPY